MSASAVRTAGSRSEHFNSLFLFFHEIVLGTQPTIHILTDVDVKTPIALCVPDSGAYFVGFLHWHAIRTKQKPLCGYDDRVWMFVDVTPICFAPSQTLVPSLTRP